MAKIEDFTNEEIAACARKMYDTDKVHVIEEISDDELSRVTEADGSDVEGGHAWVMAYVLVRTCDVAAEASDA